ncbi:MAG: hypothetical protein ACE5F6_14870 [Anaerolineae bacterium]
MNRPGSALDGQIEVDEVYIVSGWKAGLKPPRPPRRRRPYLAPFRGVSKVYLPLYAAAFEFRHNHRHLTNWQQAGVLLRLLCRTDGPTVRRALRDNKVVELCDLPT